MLTNSALREELVQRGKAIYETRLKALMEPQYNNQYIAIHVDSGNYTVAKSTGAATRALLKTHPADGRIYLRKIGSEPEYSLAARILAGEMLAEQPKRSSDMFATISRASRSACPANREH